MMEDFSNAPPTISELRACKTESAKDWTARDALVSLLRDIDSGKIEDIGPLVVIYERKNGEGRSVGYSVSSPKNLLILGLVTRFLYEYNESL